MNENYTTKDFLDEVTKIWNNSTISEDFKRILTKFVGGESNDNIAKEIPSNENTYSVGGVIKNDATAKYRPQYGETILNNKDAQKIYDYINNPPKLINDAMKNIARKTSNMYGNNVVVTTHDITVEGLDELTNIKPLYNFNVGMVVYLPPIEIKEENQLGNNSVRYGYGKGKITAAYPYRINGVECTTVEIEFFDGRKTYLFKETVEKILGSQDELCHKYIKN